MAAPAGGLAVEERPRPATTATDPRPHLVWRAAPDRPSTDPGTGVDLLRLLEITRLTPAQAAAIATDVLCALESLHATGDAGGGFGLDAVRVGADGRSRLTGRAGYPGDGSPAPTGHCRDDLTAAAAVLTELTLAARRPLPNPDQRATDLLCVLDHATADAARPEAEAGPIAALLRGAGAASASARAELAALVAAAGGRQPPGRPIAAASTAEARRLVAPAAPREDRLRAAARSVARRSWKWALSFVVLVATILIEFAFLHDQITRDIGLVLGAGRQGTTTAAGPEPPAPVPA
ncbi:hypothetical protein, partial [Pseudonocardia acidicola]